MWKKGGKIDLSIVQLASSCINQSDRKLHLPSKQRTLHDILVIAKQRTEIPFQIMLTAKLCWRKNESFDRQRTVVVNGPGSGFEPPRLSQLPVWRPQASDSTSLCLRSPAIKWGWHQLQAHGAFTKADLLTRTPGVSNKRSRFLLPLLRGASVKHAD